MKTLEKIRLGCSDVVVVGYYQTNKSERCRCRCTFRGTEGWAKASRDDRTSLRGRRDVRGEGMHPTPGSCVPRGHSRGMRLRGWDSGRKARSLRLAGFGDEFAAAREVRDQM